MGWLAAGCCTAITGYVLCRFLLVNRGSTPAVSLLKAGQDLRPITKITCGEIPSNQPILDLPTPRMEISHTRGDANREMAENSSAETPEISMAPPPLPVKAASPPRLKAPSFGVMPAPPRPGNGYVRPPPSAAASLRVPTAKPLPNASLAPTSSIMPPGKQVSRKVILEPGHSPLDWAALTNNANSRLRGKDAPGENMLRITPSQLKAQNGRKGKDAWTVYQGKIYNISPYVPFHPGGAGEILRGAGKDSAKLFMEAHPWVNWDGMLSECLVGILVSEEEVDTNSGGLDEMD